MANQSKFKDEEKETPEKKSITYKKRCVMPSCSYFAPDGLHLFPKKDFLKKKWLEICGLKEEGITKTSKICSHHFHPDHYIERKNSTQRSRLKICALPTMNLAKVRNIERLIRQALRCGFLSLIGTFLWLQISTNKKKYLRFSL